MAKSLPETETGATATIPVDVIVYGILTKLDAKSLVRFRSVHRHWHALLDHPSFAKAHSASKRLLLTYFDPDLHRHFFFSAPLRGGAATPLPSISLPSDLPFLLSDSTEGLVCLYNDLHTCVCNPSTQQTTTLPPSHSPFDLTTHLDYTATCAIGYEPRAGLHKVVRACTFSTRWPGRNLPVEEQVFEVLTLAGDEPSWRAVELPESVHLLVARDSKVCACFVNGAVHFKAFDRASHENVFVAFDLETENFRVFGAPNTTSFSKACLFQIGGNLGMSGEYADSSAIKYGSMWRGWNVVWILQEYEEKLWSRSRIIGFNNNEECYGSERQRWCRQTHWSAMGEDQVSTSTVLLSDGRELVVSGMINGLEETGTFTEYVETLTKINRPFLSNQFK